MYPYDYMDNMNKFQERQLPPKEAFFSYLTEEHISDEDYQHRRVGGGGGVNNGGLKTQTVDFQLLANSGGMENKL